ncbi:hypothetical protein BSZ28_08825 [Pseudomonas moraviensis]|nr:hypothetical protein BSZ28_08825 [Pseudomonas moraviensis]
MNAEKAPHPNPLPKGEGTDWGMLEIDADLSALHRIQSCDSNQKRCGLSGRCITGDTSPQPSPSGRGLG